MNSELCKEARDYGIGALRAFERAGGDQLVQKAEQNPGQRGSLVEPSLVGLGAFDLRPRESAEELEAAAALCRSAGWYALPYPLAERLARPPDLAVDGLIVIGDGRSAGAVAGLDLRWAALALNGQRYLATVCVSNEPARATLLLADLRLAATSASPTPALDFALGLVLACWTLLGMLDRAISLTRSHVMTREQFGQPLAQFQGVRFQLSDAEVERAGVEELAKYALWSLEAQRPDALQDAMALRLAAVEAADTIFRISHQLHGAMGFCDESPLSWISRYSQPLRRLPWGPSGTLDHLTRCVGRAGITGLFTELEPSGLPR